MSYPEYITKDTSDVLRELEKAKEMHGPMRGYHEGWAVIWEEVDELWDEVRAKHPDKQKIRKEAVQVAAMALRFLGDVCREGPA